MNKIDTENLSVGYGKQIVINDININILPGEIVTLLGPNGSGKSTILKTIAGAIEELGGQILYENREFNTLTKDERAKTFSEMFTWRKEAMYYTVQEVVELGRFPYTGLMGKLSDKDNEIVSDVMKQTQVFDLKYKEYEKLSDGQKQRVLLARALCQQPQVLILDEPTSFLDISYKIEFLSLLKNLSREKGITIIMSLHELEMAYGFSDKIVCVKNSIIDRAGKPDEIFQGNYIEELFNIKKGLTIPDYSSLNWKNL